MTRTNALTGQMRMLWWKEGISEAFKGKPPNHPVMKSITAGGCKSFRGRSGRVPPIGLFLSVAVVVDVTSVGKDTTHQDMVRSCGGGPVERLG